MLLKGFTVFTFVFVYALPMITFVLCYWRILMVVRRQNKITAGSHAGRSTRVQVVQAVTASTNDDGTTVSNAKTGQGKGVEHSNRCKV